MNFRIIAIVFASTCLLLAAASCRPLSPAESSEYWRIQVGNEFFPENPEKVCRLHRVETVEVPVPELAGMPLQPTSYKDLRYVRARLTEFPNSYWFVRSGSCIGPDLYVFRRVCPKCRQIERHWRKRHGLLADEVFPLD